MKFCLVLPDLSGGGAERVNLTLARGLRDRGHEVHLVLLGGIADYPVPDGVELHRLGREGTSLPAGALGKWRVSLRLRRWRRRAKEQRDFDLTLVSLPFASESARLAGLRGAWHQIHNSLHAEIEQIEARDPVKAARRLARYRRLFDGERLIAVSAGVADELRDRIGLRTARIEPVYNPFDFDEIARSAATGEPDLPARPYVVHAGRFVRQKRHDLLLEAYARAKIPHDLLLLTKPSAELQSLIAARGLSERVHIAGFRENPFPWFRRAAALALSSDFEGFGNVLVEALACGTPVVSTNCPWGPREILSGPLGRWLSPVGDADALARNLRDIVESPPAIDRSMLERFSLKSAVDAFESLVERI